jgi:hypothetical protein
MAAKNRRAKLQADLMAAKVVKPRGKPGIAPPKPKVAPGAEQPSAALCASLKGEQVLCAKGNATAAGFRPWHWSYEPAPGVPSEPNPVLAPPSAPVETTARPPLEAAARSPQILALSGAPDEQPELCGLSVPIELPTELEPAPCEPPDFEAVQFDYPCNAGLEIVREAVDSTIYSADRALLQATTRTIAALIGKVLDAREAAAAARLEEQRRAYARDTHTRRVASGTPTLTAEGLIAELKSARRSSVRAMRKSVRRFDPVFSVR